MDEAGLKFHIEANRLLRDSRDRSRSP